MIERNGNGQFEKGHSGNPNGRPRLDAEQKYLKTLRKALPQKDVREIIKKLIVKAKAGNIQAVKLLLEYAIGRPTQYVSAEVTGKDGAPLRVEYVNDWRSSASLPAPWAADGQDSGEAVQLVSGGETLEEDDAGNGDSG